MILHAFCITKLGESSVISEPINNLKKVLKQMWNASWAASHSTYRSGSDAFWELIKVVSHVRRT